MAFLKFLVRSLRSLRLKLRQWRPVWFYLVNWSPRSLYRKQNIKLDHLEKRIVKDLREDGIATATLEELFPNSNWLSRLQAVVTSKRPQAKPQVSKPFLMQLWDSKSAVLDSNNPFTLLAIEERIIKIVTSYLQLFPRFYFLEGSITLPVNASDAPQASQRWHRDPEDPTMVKVFFYLNDVGDGNGPFHYVKKSHFLGSYGKIFPQKPPAGRYPPVEDVAKVVDPKDIKVCTGKAGTVIFCDTAGLHRGGYATSGERWMFTSGYSSPKSLWPSRFSLPENFDQSKLSEMAKLTLNR